LAKEIGFAKGDQEMILLALEEAVTNVIEHAFESVEESFQIIFEPSAGGIKIIVKDKGLPYDPALIPQYEASDDIELMSPKGLGSFIMKKCVDEVFFYNLGKEGKELHLVKHLPSRSVIDHSADSEMESLSKSVNEKIVFSSPPVLEMRLMKPSEALDVSRLFYRTYGYSYLSDIMYYPDRLAELNREGLITSVVAVTRQEEIVGHLAIARDTLDDMIAETGKGAVKASFRGFDIFTRMQKFLNEEARTMGIKGIYGRAVTVHSASQKMTEKTGYKDCAVVLGFAPGDIAFKGIAEVLPQRETLVYSFQAVVQLPVTDLYLPPHHKLIIRKIYANLNLSRNFIPSPADPPMDGNSVLKSKIFSNMNAAEIVIHHYGKDCTRVLQHLLKDLCAKKVDHISLFLNLGDPITSHICKEIEKLGFFISGIIPCLHFDDTLILQYLNNIIIDYSQLTIHSDIAREILSYIKERDPNTTA
jgi:anti-sigma regulatory factor (Ser/Thr protein kinase)